MKLRGADGRLALAWRVAPILLVLFLAANAAVLFVLVQRGGSASGERLQVDFAVECGQAAADVMAARADAMGLGDPQWTVRDGHITLIATMPGLDDDRTAVPALLARPGVFEVRSHDDVLVSRADLMDAGLTLDESGMPYVAVTVTPDALDRLQQAAAADPEGTLDFMLDGERISARPNRMELADEPLRVIVEEGSTRDKMRKSADRAFVIEHGPQPCDVTVTSVTLAGGAAGR